MPLEDSSKVDAISTDPRTGAVWLTIFDAWDWIEETRHLRALRFYFRWERGMPCILTAAEIL